MKNNELAGLSGQTALIFARAGLTTREKIAAAGEVKWLMLPMFGRKRMDEVTLWLGNESPAARRAIDRAVKLLESHGYTIMKPNDKLSRAGTASA